VSNFIAVPTFSLHFFPFDFDLDNPLIFSPLSFYRSLAIMAFVATVSVLDFLRTSSYKRAPTIDSNFKESIVLKLIEVTKWSHD